MTTMRLTIEDILAGCGLGGAQSVGQMDVVPLFDEGGVQDDTFAPPDMEVGTSDYGTVGIRNTHQDRPTIVPTGAGWVTEQRAQDHAIPSAALVAAGGSKTIDTARCIEESQCALIQGASDFLILPASLRASALGGRTRKGYALLWGDIASFNAALGLPRARGHLVNILREFGREMDQFVAQFELLPKQIGAIVLIGGHVVGIERAPNVEYWERLWTPLIRVCYGSLAIKARKVLGDTPPPTRAPLQVETRTLTGLQEALVAARSASAGLVTQALEPVMKAQLLYAGSPDDQLNGAEVLTLGNRMLAGQVVQKDGLMPYVSMTAAGA